MLTGASGLYDRARPTYPEPALQKILSLLPPSAAVVELGAGTGLFSRGLLNAALAKPGSVSEWLAVEPSEGMRVGFEKKLPEVAALEGSGLQVAIVDGLFDKIPVEDGKADLVSLSSWPRSAILRSCLADRTSARRLRGLRSRYRHGYWKSIFETAFYPGTFEAPVQELYHRDLPATEQGVIDRVLSKSFITALSEEEQAKVVKEIEAVLKKGEGMKWINEDEGIFEYPYDTDLYVIRKKE
ncbi:SPOSA6832_01033 [Sporobolomyces salmonicolor]|uniref:SPOSA6832_01033-mRNA-1:cds n=1 Tax=Sporidiobolus salmonicolor TaxID=5005 RepID=A0A0D6EHV4_SPOSA|nr:SPOSA6832_01033 [Sporobolomyces salmonicolor]